MKEVILGALLACSTFNVANAMDFARTADSGLPARMHIYRSWKSDCSANHGVVKVMTKPKNGKLMSRDVSSIIEVSRKNPERTSHCRGRSIRGFQVDYRSNQGFTGTDTFQIEVTFGKRKPEIDNYTVTVK